MRRAATRVSFYSYRRFSFNVLIITQLIYFECTKLNNCCRWSLPGFVRSVVHFIFCTTKLPPMNVTDVCSEYYRLVGNTTIGFSSCNDCYSCKSTSGTICHHYTQYLNIIKCIQTQFFHLFQHKGTTTIRDQSCNDLKSCSGTLGKLLCF